MHERIERENAARAVVGRKPLRPPSLSMVRRRVRHLQPWLARIDDRPVADD